MTRVEIENIASKIVTNSDVLPHVVDMMVDMYNHIFYKEKYSYPSKFIKLCIEENWEYAIGVVSDSPNRQILKQTRLYHDFIKMIKTSPEYISKIREQRLNQIFEK